MHTSHARRGGREGIKKTGTKKGGGGQENHKVREARAGEGFFFLKKGESMTQHEARRHVLDRPLAGTEFRRRPSEKALALALRHPPSFLSPYHVQASNVPFPTRLRPKSSCAEIIECSSDIIDVEWLRGGVSLFLVRIYVCFVSQFSFIPALQHDQPRRAAEIKCAPVLLRKRIVSIPPPAPPSHRRRLPKCRYHRQHTKHVNSISTGVLYTLFHSSKLHLRLNHPPPSYYTLH